MDDNTNNPMMDDEQKNPEENAENTEVNEAVGENEETAAEPVIEAEKTEEEPAQEEKTEQSYEDFVKQTESADTTVGGVTPQMPVEPAAEEIALEPQAKAKKSKSKVAAIVAIVVLLLAATGLLLYFIFGANSVSGKLNKTVLSVDGVESSFAEFYIYSQSISSNYYYQSGSQLSDDQLKEYVLKQMKVIDAAYKKALDEGFVLEGEYETALSSTMASLSDYAEQQSMSAEEFVTANFGKGITLDMYKAIMEKSILANAYMEKQYNAISEKYENGGSDDAVAAEYAKNKKTYDVSSISYFYFDSSDSSSAANADKVIEAVKSGTSFADAVNAVKGDSSAKISERSGLTYEVYSSSFGEDIANWVYAQDDAGNYTNKTGSITKVEANGAIYVIYVNKEPAKDDTVPASVYYVKVDVDTDDVKSADECDLAAKASANSIYKEYTSKISDGKANESIFKSIVDKYAESNSDVLTADEYEDMKNDGSQDSAVEAWAFDAARKVGDSAVVKGDGAYYVLFYVSKAAHASWYTNISSSLLSAEQSAWADELLKSYEDKIVTDDDLITEALAYYNSSLTTAQSAK